MAAVSPNLEDLENTSSLSFLQDDDRPQFEEHSILNLSILISIF